MDREELVNILLDVFDIGTDPDAGRILEEFDRLWGMETLCANALKDAERFKKWWADDHEWNIQLKEEIETLQRVADWFQALSEERTKHIAELERENQKLDAEVVACMSTFDATIDDLQPKDEEVLRGILEKVYADMLEHFYLREGE